MAIRNFFYTQKRFSNSLGRSLSVILAVLTFFTASCSHKQSPIEQKESSPRAGEVTDRKSTEVETEQETLKKETPHPSELLQKEPPKLGIILGASGLKSYAYIGVLHELEKARIPVHAIVGLEWGALVASLYAAKGQANDLEWQMLKLKESDLFSRGLFGNSSDLKKVNRLEPFLKKTLGDLKFSETTVKFACTTSKNGRLNWKEQGQVASALKGCMSYPPFFTEHEGQAAEPFAIEASVELLKRQGADIVVFVNGIEAGPLWTRSANQLFQEKIIWRRLRTWYRVSSQTSSQVSSWSPSQLPSKKAVDETIGIYLPTHLRSFSGRRSAIKRGHSAGKTLAELLTSKYGF